jgi:hypothetical protein
MAIQRTGQIGHVQGGFLDFFCSPTPTWEQPWLGSSLADNLGWPLMVVGLFGAVWGLGGRMGRAGRIHAGFVALFLLTVCAPGHVKVYRYLLPMLPSLFILGAATVQRLASVALPRQLAPAGGLLLALGLGIVPATHTARYLSIRGRPSTNTLARQWIERNIPPGSTVLLSPFFVDNLEKIPDRTFLFLEGGGGRTYRVPGDPRNNAELAPIYHPGLIDEMRARGIQYLVANDWFDGGAAPIPENLRWFPVATAASATWRARLAREADCLESWEGWEAGRPGPGIEVWRLRAADAPPSPPPGGES